MSRARHNLAPARYVFGDESGSFKNGDWMVVGALYLSQPDRARDALKLLRKRTGRLTELRYSTSDKYQLSFALAVLAWFFDTADAEYRCIAKSGDEFDLGYYKGRIRGLNPDTLAYNFTYRELLAHNLPPEPHRLIAKVDERSRHRFDNLLDYLKAEIPTIVWIGEADSKSDDLLQVADLLTGCVRGDLVNQTEPVRRALTSRFLEGCGTGSVLNRPTKCSGEKVDVWRYRADLAKKRAAGPS